MAANPYKLTVSQIRDRRRSAKHNVFGVKGLAVRVDGDIQTIRALAMLPAAVQRRVMRQALTAAARPVRAAMKAGAVKYERESTESIGAVGRSFGIKVATSKKDPSISYALIGAVRGYSETVTLNKQGAIEALRVRRFRGRRTSGVQKVNSRQLKNLGPTARKARLDPRNGRIQRRTPTRYLHLLELGGKARRLRAGGFMDKAARSQAGSSMQEFNRILFAGINREFSKMAAK